MEETKPQVGIYHHQMKVPVAEIGYIKLSCWRNESHGNSQRTQAIAQINGCLLQTDGKALLLKEIPIYLIEMEKLSLFIPRTFIPID